METKRICSQELTLHRATRKPHSRQPKCSDQQVHRASGHTGTIWPGWERRKKGGRDTLDLRLVLKAGKAICQEEE